MKNGLKLMFICIGCSLTATHFGIAVGLGMASFAIAIANFG